MSDNVILETVHVKYCKYILGVHRNTSNHATRGELGSYPIAIDLICHSIKYWLGLQKYDTDSLAYQAYIDSYISLNRNKNGWLAGFSNILKTFNFGNIWDNNGTLNGNKFINNLKEELCRLNWEAHINSNVSDSKLRTYVTFKTTFGLENYLLAVKSFNKRATFTKLRTSAHDLRIETGRYNEPNKLPVVQRLCQFCDRNEIEDEFHFIMQCDRYKDERGLLFDKLKTVSSFENIATSREKFNFIMSGNNGDSEVLNIVSTFIYDAYKKRKS